MVGRTLGDIGRKNPIYLLMQQGSTKKNIMDAKNK
jgi:hypothetical protein